MMICNNEDHKEMAEELADAVEWIKEMEATIDRLRENISYDVEEIRELRGELLVARHQQTFTKQAYKFG